MKVYLNRIYKVTIIEDIEKGEPIISKTTVEGTHWEEVAKKISIILKPNEYIKSVELIGKGKVL
jgi:hypothetical protein